jgi:hypothetical protein
VHSDSLGNDPFEERSLSDHLAKRAVWGEVVDSVGEFGLTGWIGDQFVEPPREGLSRGIPTYRKPDRYRSPGHSAIDSPAMTELRQLSTIDPSSRPSWYNALMKTPLFSSPTAPPSSFSSKRSQLLFHQTTTCLPQKCNVLAKSPSIRRDFFDELKGANGESEGDARESVVKSRGQWFELFPSCLTVVNSFDHVRT